MKFLTSNYLGKIERCQSSEGEGETLTKTTPCTAHCRGTCNILSSVEILQNMNSHIIVQLPHHVTSPFHHEFTAFFHLHLSSATWQWEQPLPILNIFKAFLGLTTCWPSWIVQLKRWTNKPRSPILSFKTQNLRKKATKDDKPGSMEHQENELESKVLQVNCITQSIIWQRGVQPKTVYTPSCYAPLGPIQNSFMNLNCKKIVLQNFCKVHPANHNHKKKKKKKKRKNWLPRQLWEVCNKSPKQSDPWSNTNTSRQREKRQTPGFKTS